MSQVMTVSQIRIQLAVRTAWEDKIHGGVSKAMQQISASFARKIKGESDMTFRHKALGEIVKRLNINSIRESPGVDRHGFRPSTQGGQASVQSPTQRPQ